jgi:hypothetical protein
MWTACGSQWTRRWRGRDSNPRSPVKGAAVSGKVTAERSNEQCRKSAVPLTGDRGFESLFLQRGVRCEPNFRGRIGGGSGGGDDTPPRHPLIEGMFQSACEWAAVDPR